MDTILTPSEIEHLSPLPGDSASSGIGRCICYLEDRLRRTVTHAEFEQILAATILDQRLCIQRNMAREEGVKAACNFDISGDTSPETTIRRMYHELQDAKREIRNLSGDHSAGEALQG